jgi:hypothetical protein
VLMPTSVWRYASVLWPSEARSNSFAAASDWRTVTPWVFGGNARTRKPR